MIITIMYKSMITHNGKQHIAEALLQSDQCYKKYFAVSINSGVNVTTQIQTYEAIISCSQTNFAQDLILIS